LRASASRGHFPADRVEWKMKKRNFGPP
jgi:hypothetical protein